MLARTLSTWALLGLLVPASFGQCEVMRLFASDNKSGAFYGAATAFDGATAVVGAYGENSTGTFAGATYVYDVSRGAPVELQKLIPTNVSYSAQSGWSLALEGDWLAVGNYNESPFGLVQAGSVNLYHRNGPAAPFVLAQKITAGDPKTGAFFGFSLAMSGGRLVVGAQQDPTLGGFAGAGYVFELQSGTWVQTAKLLASDGNFGDFAGRAVALDGDTILLSANNKEGPGGLTSVGAVYVFEHSASGWSETQKLTVANPHSFMSTGWTLGLRGATAFMSTVRDVPFNNTGAVHRFERSNGVWQEVEVLVPQDPENSMRFGTKLVYDGVRLIVSATGDTDLGSHGGSVYIFEQAGSSWIQTKKLLLAGGGSGDNLGASLALWGDRLLVSAIGTDEACPSMITCDSGSAILYELGSDTVQYCSCPTQGPCGNHDDFGGCVHAGGQGAILSACGGGSIALDDLKLVGQWLPPNAPTLLCMGPSGAPPSPFGDGLMCVAAGPGGIYRQPFAVASPGGHVELGPGLLALGAAFPGLGPVTPGDDRHFQLWFRSGSSPCGTSNNLSNALRVLYRP